jgi:uncharacterized membrane protein YidH (DUF202 family)
MKDGTRSSFALIGAGLFIIAFGIMLLALIITQWDAWVAQLMLSGMAIIIVIAVVLIIIGVFLIIKFVA